MSYGRPPLHSFTSSLFHSAHSTLFAIAANCMNDVPS
jgi:hypothetical protein